MTNTPRLQIETVATASHILNPRNARTHTAKQIAQIANSIERFGFTNPVLIDGNNSVVAGHGRSEAAKLLGMISAPVLCF